MKTRKYKWLDRKEYPFQPHYLDINGTSLHYVDEGSGDPILFVHGTPSWSFDFRKVMKSLSKNYRCIAPDHIGFGLSEKPAHYDYSLQNHTNSLELLIIHLNLKNITIVVHDFGGPIGLQYAIKHPETIKQIVVLNSWLWNFSDNLGFKAFKKVGNSPLLPLLYKYYNFSPKVLLPKSFGDHTISKSILQHYTKAFAKPSERVGCLAFAYSLLNDQGEFEMLWNQRNVLQSKKILFIWGMKDKFITPEFLHKFSHGFMNSTVLTLHECGHIPQEEEPETVIHALTQFLKEETTSELQIFPCRG